MITDTNGGTKNGSKGSESAPQPEAVSHPTPTRALREAFGILCEAQLDSLGW